VRKLIACVFLLSFIAGPSGWAQAPTSDLLINDPAQNRKGVWRTAIAAMPDGRFAVAWQDFNDYTVPVPAQPRIAVRMFSPTGTPIGPPNLFRGESRPLSIWTSDSLAANADLAFLPNGTLLVAVEHEGDLSIGTSSVLSSEVGIGAIAADGSVIDVSGPNVEGVILWLIPLGLSSEENPRMATAPNGFFFAVLHGPTFDTERHAVAIQVFDPQGRFAGDFFSPHTTDLPPRFNHVFPDVASNGNVHVVVWQDGRQDPNFDISAQFYNNTGPIGGNIRVNRGDPPNTLNVWPSVAMNPNGSSVVVWADTRNGPAGAVFGQLYNIAGQPVGGNFQISTGQGEICDRPEVAMLNNGRFMAVWTDSANCREVNDTVRARGRQFDANANPLGPPFILPSQNVPSGLANIATDGASYYCSWLDDRFGNNNPNVFAKRIP
jgi:hypothetical protein